MAYVIAEPCIGHKEGDCVEVCPVDCIDPLPDAPDYLEHQQLFIDPAACIDCDECYLVCPHAAVFPEEQLPEKWAQYAALNAGHFEGAAQG